MAALRILWTLFVVVLVVAAFGVMLAAVVAPTALLRHIH